MAEGENLLQKSGSLIPGEEAVILLSYLLRMNRSHLFLNRTMNVSSLKVQLYHQWIHKRCSGKPVQYITGFQNFMGLEFKVSQGVFIPRPETEILVEKILHIIKAIPEKDKIFLLDIGVGSGVIPVAILHYLKNIPLDIHFHVIDISRKAIQLARENARRFHCEDRIDFHQGDMFIPLQNTGNPMHFNGIISNPPYIDADEWDELKDEVRLYEPREALYGGIDGLDFYRKIIQQSPAYLKRNGFLALEIGHKQKDALCQMFTKNGSYQDDVTAFCDYYQNDRGIIAFFRGEV